MVTEGDFTVKIINAETNDPFKEHIDPRDMKAYVEVEPDVEYYLLVSGTHTTDVLAHAEVDKVSVGYQIHIPAYDKNTQRIGCRNDRGEIAAFRFRKTLIDNPNSDDDECSKDKHKNNLQRSWTGTVTVSFYGCLPNTEQQSVGSHLGKGWHKGDIGATIGVTPLDQKKGVHSDEGRMKLQQDVKWGHYFKRGNKLGEINLLYCSTVGLINYGLLPRPDAPAGVGEDPSTRAGKRVKTEMVDLTDDD